MNTISERRESLNKVMREFESKRGYDSVAGFYAGIVEALAVDKPSDYEFVMEILRKNMK
jgi:hypothetical protein